MDQHSSFSNTPVPQYPQSFSNKLTRWVFEHSQLTKIVLSVFLCGTYTALLSFFHMPLWFILTVDLISIFGTVLVVNNAPLTLIKHTYDPLQNQCDPYPLLHETKECLSQLKNEQLKHIILIDHCAALSYVGKYQEAYDLSKNLNIDKYSGTVPFCKIVYYHNLASFCTELNKYEEADAWQQKADQLFADIKNTKQKKLLMRSIQMGKVDALYRKGEYDEALKLLENQISKTKVEAVNDAMMLARLYLAKNDTEKAKTKLQYVIENGNRLYAVTEAMQRMEQF